ncbi:MAG TPA: TonB-dependent receptor [Sphingomonas sp.]|nr:TonB-dependent receptor [Sphingomonas sp.]
MRRTEVAAAALCLFASIAPAQAAERRRYAIPPGSLADTLIAVGEQAGVTIGVSDTRARLEPSRGLHGLYSLRAALKAVLRGSGYDFVFADPQTVRIVRAADHKPSRTTASSPASPGPSLIAPPADIIVTASKVRTPLALYAGDADVVDIDARDQSRIAARGTEAITVRLPTITSTSLGPGRNKLFVRGVADSSFNGPTQATVGQYLGDVRLTYNAPDPDLNLYDMRRIELLEGPQGTLYGTGAIGGILRLVPNEPDPGGFAASLAGGVTATAHGGEGSDIAGMANLPLLRDHAALRLVGFRAIEPGYIDDIGRGLKNVNRSGLYGGRATLRLEPGDGWTIDIGGALQNIGTRDGQYAERGLPPLTRRSALAQPFDNDYLLGSIVVHKAWGGVELVSASGVVDQDVTSNFDATGADGTSGLALFTEDNAITLLSHETRLSGALGERGSWIGGFSILRDVQRLHRRLGDPAAQREIQGVRNDVTEAALFGQIELPLAKRLALTLGGRFTFDWATGEPIGSRMAHESEPSRREGRFSPTLALAWRANDRLTLFTRYQQGFRAGGLAVSQAGSQQSVMRFKPDEISSIEAGLRLGRRDQDRFWASATLSYARWKDIQADLVDTRGLPFTDNIGDGRILGLEAQAAWSPLAGLTLEGGLFLNDSQLYAPAPGYESSQEAELPDVAETGGRLGFSWKTAFPGARSLAIDGSLRYVGRSELGVAAPLEIRQGGFTEAAIGARLDFGGFGLSLDVTNLTDSRGNRFSFGNPFTVGDHRQITPLRPRSVRIGFDARF